MSRYTVKFAGNDLSIQDEITLTRHDFHKMPTRQIKINKLARRDKSVITSSEYSDKSISVNFEVAGKSGAMITREATESRVAFLKSLVQAQNEQLTVNLGEYLVAYVATMNEFNIAWVGTTALVTVVFIASDPIGKANEVTTAVSETGETTSATEYVMMIDGSATAYPTISVTLSDVTDGTGKTVSLINKNTNQGIIITRNWADGDIIVSDSDVMEVTVNGISVDFTGMFPRFPAGEQILQYTDDLTARTYDISVTYNPRLV